MWCVVLLSGGKKKEIDEEVEESEHFFGLEKPEDQQDAGLEDSGSKH